MAASKIFIVGIGDDGLLGLTESAKQKIQRADLIAGSERTLELVGRSDAEQVVIGTDLGQLTKKLQEGLGKRKMVVLATGDPLFYGVARYLCDRLGKEAFEVVPHVSSMQLAFARVMESWEEAYLTNVANHPLEETIERIRIAEKVGLFPSEEATPSVIARELLDEGIDYFHVHVCENLGSHDEIVTQGTLAEIAKMEFGPLSVMILARKPEVPDSRSRHVAQRLFGNPDEAFRQRRPKQGLLTPSEVRALALAQLNVRPSSQVWDIGAGSGSVSIEAAQLAVDGRVFAVEPDPEDCELIRDNARKFGVLNVEVVTGQAPKVFAQLPDPDCVFIGSAGRETIGILTKAFERLRPGGSLVANVTSLENVSAATETLKTLVPHVGLLMVNLARGIHQLQSVRFEAMNPSFLVFVVKGL